MIHWRETVLALSAHDAVRPHLCASAPAWVFTRAGDRVLWCNAAGAVRLGATSFAEIAARRFSSANSLRRGLQGMRRHLRQTPNLARIALPGGGLSGAELCQCQALVVDAIDAPGRANAILVVALTADTGRGSEMSGAAAAEKLVELLASADTLAGLIDGKGNLVTAVSRDKFGEIGTADDPAALVAAARHGQPITLAIKGEVRALVLAAVEMVPLHTRDPQPSIPQQVSSPAPESLAPDQPEPAPPSPREDIAAERDTFRLRRALNESATKPAPVTPHNGPDQPVVAPATATGSAKPETPSRNPVRFLWQTDAAHRILFVSPGLGQTVGRNAEVVGEIWDDAADRLRLDPRQKVAQALVRHDTWSGLTVWWPAEGKNIYIPAELTALPVFSIDQSFQGFRGFGVLKPAEAITATEFDARHGAPQSAAGATPSLVPTSPTLVPPPAPDNQPDNPPDDPASSATGPASDSGKVVPLRGNGETKTETSKLTLQEHTAFEEIAADLAERVRARLERPEPGVLPAAGSRDAIDPPAAKTPSANIPAASSSASDVPAPDTTPDEISPAPKPPEPPANPVATPVAPSSGTIADQARISELTAILNTATDGVLIVDGDGKVEELNSSAQALFAMDESEAKGRSFTELLLPQSWQTALDYLSGLRGSGVASLLNEGREVVGKCGEGSIALFMTMGRISDAGSGRFCAVLRDITQWKHTEADLVAARKKAEDASSQKSDFLARVSHEIRTPLNAIIGFADVMIDERFGQIGNNRYREYMRDIRMSGEHVVNLVNDLLDISKIEAGKIDLNFTAVPLNELVRECMSLMQPQANKNHVVLRSSLVSDIPAIVADQTSLRQIVLNLLSNSVKFTRSGGQVIASTSLTNDGEAELRIRDNGEGMGEDELARAMEPFRQLSTASIGSQAGTGLGLPLTKALVEANRARFSIESARGEGTIVKVTFPPTRVLSE